MLPVASLVAAALALAQAPRAAAQAPACTNGFQYPSFAQAPGGVGFPGCPLPPPDYLPANCYGSNPPADEVCAAANWNLPGVDPCKPTKGLIRDVNDVERLGNQLMYIKSATEFCLALPDPSNPWLKMVYYDQGLLPQAVGGEGLMAAFCFGGYTSSGGGLSAQKVPAGAITSAYMTTNFASPGKRYIQIHGEYNPALLGIQPPATDMGGQYDDSGYKSCGKEPYSGVDPIMSSPNGPFQSSSPFTFGRYVQYLGNAHFCMRICEGLGYGTLDEAPCSAQFDTAGCANWGITSFPAPGSFTTVNPAGETMVTTMSVVTETSASPTSAGNTTSANSGAGSANSRPAGTQSTASASSSASPSSSSAATGKFEGAAFSFIGSLITILSFF